MASIKIQRKSISFGITIAASAALSGEIPMSEYTMGIIHMPDAWTAASIGFQVSPSSGGTFQPLYDNNGVLVEIPSPTADNSFEIPPEAAAARFIKIWSQTSGSGVNQVAERSLTVDLKG